MQPISPIEIPLVQGWKFSPDENESGGVLHWQAMDFDDDTWQSVSIPHSWNNAEPTKKYEGIAWYRLSFLAPPNSAEACVRLRFEAVFYLAKIWLNDEYLGEHEGGYTPFEFDISSFVHPQGENLLAVRVDNKRATNRLPAHLYEGRSYGWKNYGGIVRGVNLLLNSCVYVDSLTLDAVPHMLGVDQADQALIAVKVDLRNTTSTEFHGSLSLTVLDSNGREIVVSTPVTATVAAQCTTRICFDPTYPDPHLWHFDHPYLYTCAIKLVNDDGVEVDRKTIHFGVRQVEWQSGQFVLNGEPVRLAGLSRHADVPGHGLAETPLIMAQDFDQLKTLNMVIARPIHYPQHEFVYDYCDRNGILLSPELPAWQLTAGQMADAHIRELAKQQLEEMIAAARNHPCVWAWSIGNELESDTVAGRAFVRDMAAYVKSIDPTRPVSFASYHLLVGRPWGDATVHSDFVMMNQYFGTWHGPKDSLGTALETIHDTWPDKIVIISEFGFFPHWERVEGPHLIDPERYYFVDDDADVDGQEADFQRQCLIKDQMATYRSKPYVAVATFWDYRGNMGVVDAAGRRRSSWYTLQEEFAPIIIELVDFSLLINGHLQVNITLRTRGPVEVDMPAYTLRGYSLTWALLAPSGKKLARDGKELLPTLAPGTSYTLKIDIPGSGEKKKLHLSIVRSTGFTVIEREVDLA